jgi:hypothetical protein
MAMSIREAAQRGAAIALTLALLACALPAGAQGAGPLWIRFFDDQNSNGALDEGEPVLTGGVAIALLNSAGVTIGTALLQDAPTAAQGVIGFQDLQPGEYTVEITSAQYRATTDWRFTRTLDAAAGPVIVEFGARLFPPEPTVSRVRGVFGLPIYLGDRDEVARLSLALAIAFIVAALMSALGLLLFVLTVRRRYRAELRALRATAGPPLPYPADDDALQDHSMPPR